MFRGRAPDEGAANGGSVFGNTGAEGQLARIQIFNQERPAHGPGREFNHPIQDESVQLLQVRFRRKLERQFVEHLQTLLGLLGERPHRQVPVDGRIQRQVHPGILQRIGLQTRTH